MWGAQRGGACVDGMPQGQQARVIDGMDKGERCGGMEAQQGWAWACGHGNGGAVGSVQGGRDGQALS